MAFTDSIMPVMLVSIDEIIATSTDQVKTMWPATTAAAIAENQRVRVEPLSPNEPCTEVDVWFYRNGASSQIYSGTGPDTGVGCDVAAGPELSTEKMRFSNNYFIRQANELEEYRCNNAAQAGEEIAKIIAEQMATSRRTFNNGYAIPILANNAMEDGSGGIISGFSTQGTNNFMKLPPTAFNSEGLLRIEQLAVQNHFSETVMVTGSNFLIDEKLAMYRAANDNERSDRLIYNDSTIYFDQKNLDSTVTSVTAVAAPTTFIFDPSVFLCWSTALYPIVNGTQATPEAIRSLTAEDPSKNFYTFTVVDPVLRFNDNGTLRPFYHNVEVKYECLRMNAVSGKREYGWTINSVMSGGLHKAPDGFNWPLDNSAGTASITGVIAVAAEA